MSVEATRDRGETLAPSEPAPLAIDPTGRWYGVRWNGRSMELFVKEPEGAGEPDRTRAGANIRDNILQIVPSPAGDRLVAVVGAGSDMAVRAFDAQSLDEQWSFSTGVHHTDLVWSSDGRWVGIAASTGAVLLDAASGEPVRRRCGMGFRSSPAPPANPSSSLNRPSLCE